METLGKPVPDSRLPCTGGSNLRLNFPFELLPNQLGGLMQHKNTYGKKVRGIERSTFIGDEKGRREWRGVKVPGHVEEVLSFAKAL